MADIVRATVKLPYQNGMERDVSENVFWFDMPDGGSIDSAAEAIHPDLNGYYADGDTGHLSISGYLASFISRSAASIEYAKVDMATGIQQGYTIELPMTDLDTPASTSLPAEVALVMSMGGSTTGVPKASARGRIYLGPFATNAVSSATGYARPAPALITAIAWGATNRLLSALTGTYPWVVYSRKLRVITVVLGGQIDNEWDTQRRRGEDPTARTVFTYA